MERRIFACRINCALEAYLVEFPEEPGKLLSPFERALELKLN